MVPNIEYVKFLGNWCRIYDVNKIQLLGAEIVGSRLVEVSDNKTPFGFDYELVNYILGHYELKQWMTRKMVLSKFSLAFDEYYKKRGEGIKPESFERYFGVLQRVFYYNPLFLVQIMMKARDKDGTYLPKYVPYHPDFAKGNIHIEWHLSGYVCLINKEQKDISQWGM